MLRSKNEDLFDREELEAILSMFIIQEMTGIKNPDGSLEITLKLT